MLFRETCCLHLKNICVHSSFGIMAYTSVMACFDQKSSYISAACMLSMKTQDSVDIEKEVG